MTIGSKDDERPLIEALLVEDGQALLGRARQANIAAHGRRVSYSRKVFLPVTHLCRNVCRYCVFAENPKPGAPAFMSPDEVLEIARQAKALACDEALFTLGDRPEDRWPQARQALDAMGFGSTLDYVGHLARLVFKETGLFPHINAGVMSEAEMLALRPSAISMGMMLESVSERLCERGGPHFGCPDKRPQVRLQTLEAAGRLSIPYTTGILIGIGETRRERLEALMAIKAVHERWGHIQEVIVQPFRAKPGTRMESAAEPSLDELCWTIAAARLVLGPAMNIQSPPNLSRDDIGAILNAGANDLGGMSPLTPDFVNPEAPWPHIGKLREDLARDGWLLTERLALYSAYVRNLEDWVDRGLQHGLRSRVDGEGLPREDEWLAGVSATIPSSFKPRSVFRSELSQTMRKVRDDPNNAAGAIAALFAARGEDANAIFETGNEIRREMCGARASYVVNRNINYTNVCTLKCGFCAFSKSAVAEGRRERPYNIEMGEISRRASEAWARGATEVCLQGGIHPDFTGATYIEIVRAAKRGAPDIHVHAFSPLEISHGAATLGVSIAEFLSELKAQGLGSLPGTAAEILVDEVRARICPDKISSSAWLDVMRTAHGLGLTTTATIMFGHVDRYENWAQHLLAVRRLQSETHGFSEFVPLPFVAAEAPIQQRGRSRAGPSFREAMLMHTIARIVLAPVFQNIQVSWVKMGAEGAQAALMAGANDVGGTLMNESITRAAGAAHGQEMSPERLERLIADAGLQPWTRTTLYRPASAARRAAAFDAPDLTELVLTPIGARRRRQSA